MKRIFLAAACAVSSWACSHEAPVETMAGFVSGTGSAECLVVENAGGTGPAVMRFAVDGNTRFEGGGAIEGNIASVTYRMAGDDELPVAVEVVTDTLYPRVLGRWETPADAELPVSIELLPRGRVVQTEPREVLKFTRWGMDGGDAGRITLFGEVVLPAEPDAPYGFSAEAVPTEAEGRRALKITSRDGVESMLYFAGRE